MASVIGKRSNGRTYYHLATSARVDGQPRISTQRYLGTAEEIAAAVDAYREQPTGTGPDRATERGFGEVAAAWRVIEDLDLIRIVDEAVGTRRAVLSPGTALAVAVLQRIAAPGLPAAAPRDIAAWWADSAAARFVRPRLPVTAVDQQRIRRALARITDPVGERIQDALLPGLVREFGSDTEAVLALDLPDYASYAPVPRSPGAGEVGRPGGSDGSSEHGAGAAAERGQHRARAHQPRTVTGLALLTTVDGAIPLLGREYSHHGPAAESYPAVLEALRTRYAAAVTQHGADPVTVVAVPGEAGEGRDPGAGDLAVVAGLPAGVRPESEQRSPTVRLPGLRVTEQRARVYGVARRVLRVESVNLADTHMHRTLGELARAVRRLDELADRLRRGATARQRDAVAAEVARITAFRWADQLLSTRLEPTESDGLRLRWRVVDDPVAALGTDERLGVQLLMTDRSDWSADRVVTAYRARHRVEGTLRHLDGAQPPGPWVFHRGRPLPARMLVSMVATMVSHLMRHRAQRAGVDLSVRELLDRLSGIREIELRYPNRRGRPRTRRLLTETDDIGRQLYDVFGLADYAPRR